MDKERMVTVAVFDIDQTLAGGVVPAHIRKYNKELDLGMTTKEEKESEKYPKTFDVPAIDAWRKNGQHAEARFQEVRSIIRISPEVHRNFLLLPGLPEGVMTVVADSLIRHGGYYTVRPQEVKDGTHEWLSNNQFPNPEKVVICDSYEDKVRKILNDFIVKKEFVDVILIDDSAEQLVSAVDQLIEKEPDLKKSVEHLILVGFGMNDKTNQSLQGCIYPNTGLRRMTLPSWEKNHVDTLLQNLKI